MFRFLILFTLAFAWIFGFVFLGIAWGAEADPGAALVMPGPGGAVTLNVGDLTFPGAVAFGFWMLARTLPAALRAWKPTLRVEVVRVEGEEAGDER